MQRMVPILLAALAIVLNVSALANFLVWLSQTDFMFGHFKGPPESLMAALILSVLGVLSTIAWLAALFLSPRHPTRPRGVLRVLGGLAVVAMTAPALIIVPVGALEWTDARTQVRRNRVARTPTDDAAGVERLILSLNDEDYHVRRRAASSLAASRIVPADAIPLLTEVASRREELTSYYAVKTLGRFGPEADTAIPTLITLLDAPSPLGLTAAEALAQIGGRALPEVLAASHSGDAQVRESAAQGLEGFSSSTEEMIVRLAVMVGDSNARVRTVAAASLGMHGIAAQAALPELDKVLYDSDPQVRAAAERAVATIAKAASDWLRANTLDLRSRDDKNRRSNAALALGARGAEARPALPALREAMDDPEPQVRLAAAKAVWRISGDADQVIPTLVALLNLDEEHDRTRRRTLDVLREMGPPARGALPAIEALATDHDPGTRRKATAAILFITDPPKWFTDPPP